MSRVGGNIDGWLFLPYLIFKIVVKKKRENKLADSIVDRIFELESIASSL